jgi:outer membrane protein W
MKKTFLVFLTIITLSFLAINESKAQIALGANLGSSLPLGTFGDAYNLGLGGGVQGSYFVSPKFAVGLNISYYTFGAKNLPSGFSSTYGILGFAPSAQYFFTEEGFRPYIGADLGYYSLSASVSSGGSSVSASKGYIGVTPQVGFLYDFSSNLALNVNIKYNLVLSDPSSLASLPVNVGILYTLSKK